LREQEAATSCSEFIRSSKTAFARLVRNAIDFTDDIAHEAQIAYGILIEYACIKAS